jgi:hypothetical protein
MKVWICQCLCPQRHCIAATAAEAEDRDEAERTVEATLREELDGMFGRLGLNPWCGLCGAPRDRWVFELARTVWNSMAEAEPVLREAGLAQRVAAALLGDLGQRPN